MKPPRPADFSLTFEIPLKAQAKERARTFVDSRTGGYRSVTPGRTKSFEAKVRDYCIEHRPDQALMEPIQLVCIFHLPRPRKPKWPLPAVRPDLDNYLKSVIDGMQGVIFKDDACIVDLYARKIYASDYPKIIVSVRTIGDLK